MGKCPDISDWLAEIKQKDSELRKNSDVTRIRTSIPPVRNTARGPKKRVQVGPSSVEKDKADKRGDEAPKGPSSKQQKYYSYEYFKEWDKFDVDKEIDRIEDEEKKRDEYKSFSKQSADVESPDEVHDPAKTYKVDDMTPLEKRVAAKREKDKGNECMKAGEINAAVGFYAKALELVPGDHLVLGNRAQAYIGIKCFYQAELDCDTALSIEPTYGKARYRRAVAREEQGKLEEARQDYDQLLKEQPDHTLGKQKVAVLEVKLRKKQEAAELVRKADEERQKYDSAPRRKIQITELDDDDDDDGMDAEALQKAREAVKNKEEQKKPSSGSRFEEIHEEESQNRKSAKLKSSAEGRILKLQEARKQKGLGNDRFKANDLEGAVRFYSRALDLLPDDDAEERHLILCNRALVLLQQKKLAEAEADCSEAIKTNASWGKAWHRRGIAKGKSGRLDEALADLEQALKLEPNSKSTIDEIKIVRDLQLAKRKEAPAPPKLRVQIEEVETDSEDDDVVVINSPGSKNKLGPQGDKDSASPPKSGPGAAASKKVSVVEVDGEDDSDEGEVIDDDVAVSVAPSGGQSAAGAKKAVMIEEVDDEDDEDEPVASKTVSVPPEALGAGKAATKLAIEEVDIDEDCEVSVPPGAAGGKSCIAEALPKIVLVEDDEDSDEDDVVVPPPVEELAIPVAAKRAAWDETSGVDVAKLRAAKKIKDEADVAFKGALFEKGAALYSSSLEALGYEEDTAAEQVVCCLNRAACNLQVREYGQVIADCGQVLDWDPENVKAYLRRGLAYEGTGRFSKAGADMREALSIEFASGGLSNLGNKAKECLERCKKAEPELRAIPIPVREKIVRPAAVAAPAVHSNSTQQATAASATRDTPAACESAVGGDFISAATFSGSKPGYVFKKGHQGVGYYKDLASAVGADDASGHAEEDISIVMSQTGVDRARAVAALTTHMDAAGAILAIEDENDGTPPPAAAASSSGADKKEEEQQPPSPVDRRKAAEMREAEDHKNKGNMAFKAGKHRSAIMHYSAAIDLDDANPTYYTNLAAAHNVLKDYENGLKMALAARKADPSYAKGVYRHAQALQGLGKLRDALTAYEEGLALMPESVQMQEGRKEVTKAIRESESSEFNALAKLKALKQEGDKKKAAAMELAASKAKEAAASSSSAPNTPASVRAVGAGKTGAASAGGAKSGADIKKAMRNMRKDMPGLCDYLMLCVPAQLPKLLNSGVEEEELVMLLRAVAEHGVTAAPQQSFDFLEGLVNVPRVPIVTAMLDRKDSKMLEGVLLRLHPSKANEAAAAATEGGSVNYNVQRWTQLRKAFGI